MPTVNPFPLKMKSPILIGTTFSLTNAPTDIGVIAAADPEVLGNPDRQAMWIDEIRFCIRDARDPGAATATFDPAVAIQVRLELGRQMLTNDFVPIKLLAPCINTPAWATSSRIVSQGLSYVWRLPKPLYVPGSKYLRCSMKLSGKVPKQAVADNLPITVDVVYAGRSTGVNDPVPPMIDVPWAAPYIGPAYTAAATLNDKSAPSDLVNPFSVPVSVQRFMYANPCITSTDVSNQLNADLLLNATIRMTSSKGRIMVRDATPVAHVFHCSSMAWDVNTQLPPQQYFLASFAGTIVNANANFQHYLAIIGSRQVDVASGL